MLKDLPVEIFVREVATASPAPSSGSVASLAGAQAAGLLSMYCNVSQDRKKLGEAVDQLQKIGEEARFIMNKLLETIDEDTIAFNQVMEAFRLPNLSDEDQRKRSESITLAVVNAADTTLQTARGSLRLLSLINETDCRGNPSALTDLGLANLQAYAGLTGSYYNSRVNLDLLKKRGIEHEIKGEAEEILSQGNEIFMANRESIESTFKKG